MEPLQSYEIPLLHPIAVHFPIALLFAGTVAILLWAAKPSPFWYRCAALAFFTGSIATIVAYFTGEAAETAAQDVPIVEEIVGVHEDMAIWTMAASLVTLLAIVLLRPRLLSGHDDTPPPGTPARVAVSVLAVVTAILIAWTSHLGGLMVWGVPR